MACSENRLLDPVWPLLVAACRVSDNMYYVNMVKTPTNRYLATEIVIKTNLMG
jgi:hypothetical protein